MKLDNTTITLIEEAAKTAHSLGIDDIIFEKGRIRCMAEDRTVVIIQDVVDYEFPFENLGITRLGIFISRLKIVQDLPNYSISINLDDSDSVQNMTLSAKGTKIDFRCSNVNTIVAPKNLKDTSDCIITINQSIDTMLSKAQSAMSAPNLTVINNDNGITFKIIDTNNDVFEHNVPATYSIDNTVEHHFVHNYPMKLFLQLFKGVEKPVFAVGDQKGILRAKVNGITVYILPQVGG